MISPAPTLFDGPALASLRRSIADNQGSEVFFVGFVDEDSRLIRDVEAVAYGNQTMTPVLLERALTADVIIHNHPSGNLEPSAQDLQMADMLMNQAGVSFVIIDNEAAQVKIVYYAPFLSNQKQTPLEKEEIFKLFEPQGAFAMKLKGYEAREAQLSMLGQIVDAFNQKDLAIIEAGTGTGKSLAYLLPALYWAQQNNEKVIITTFTKNLQQQLADKDLPFLKDILPFSFSYAIVKGKQNYICRKRFEEAFDTLKALSHSPALFDDEDRERFRLFTAVEEWLAQTREGDLEELSGELLRQVREDIQAQSDLCIHRRCPYFESCYINLSRQRVFTSDLIITNHHFFLAQLSLDYSDVNVRLLPLFSKIIIDEAHNFKKAALSFLQEQASFFSLNKNLGRLYSLSRKKNHGELNQLLVNLQKSQAPGARSCLEKIQDEILPYFEAIREKINFFLRPLMSRLEMILPGQENTLRITRKNLEDFKPYKESYLELKDTTHAFYVELSACLKQAQRLSENFLKENGILLRSVERRAASVKTQVELFEHLFFEAPSQMAVWLKQGNYSENISINRALLDITDFLQKTLFEKEYSLVFTSATLAIDKSFSALKEELGISYALSCRESILPSPFDYQTQARVLIPNDFALPQGSDSEGSLFIQQSLALIGSLVEASEGGTFILCTSFFQIRLIKDFLSRKHLPYPTFVHGEAGRAVLTKNFREHPNAILLGTDSFWEGVDIQGDNLRQVIIFKLPFRPPNDPITETQHDLIKAAGENPFLKLSLPEAVIKFKQGFGRLIRSKQDKGLIVILDRRIMEKNYSKVFFDSLPVQKKEALYLPHEELKSLAIEYFRNHSFQKPRNF